MWEPFETHGELEGRIRAVSLPQPGRPNQFLVWTDTGLFLVWFHRSLTITKLANAAETAKLFDAETGTITLPPQQPHPMHGTCGPRGKQYTIPAAAELPAGDRLEHDPDTDSLLVLDPEGHVRKTIPNYRPHAEPWSLASFAGNMSVLVVADPRSLRVFKYVVERGAEKPKWKGVGDAAQQKQLMRAVLAHPDEDTPRLMYADWLDENRDPVRAEFIRLQCRLAERQRDGPLPVGDEDAQRAFTLERQMSERWLAELPAIRGVHWQGFHRGFPTVRVASPTTLVRAAKKVWAAAPVQVVTVTELHTAGALALAESPCFDRLRSLTVPTYHFVRDGRIALAALLHAPRAAGLRALSLTSSYLTGEGVELIAASPHLTNLEWLRVAFGTITDAGAAALLASPSLGKLKGGPFPGADLSPRMRKRLKERFAFV